MKTLEWNEEYIITAEKDTEHGLKKIKSAKGKGFCILEDAKREAKKLEKEGYKNIKISIRKWANKIRYIF